MTFEEILAEVIQIVERPDMGLSANGGTDEIPRAIVAATRTMHGKDFFFRDMQEADIQFDTVGYVQELDTAALPRYRNWGYLRKWDPAFNTNALDPYQSNTLPFFSTSRDGSFYPVGDYTGLIKLIDPDAIFDNYNILKSDVCYQGGAVLKIRSSTPIRWCKAGWYTWPETDYVRGRFFSWIADLFPYAIIYHAASRIFSSIGEQEKSRKYDSPTGLIAEQVEILMKSNVRSQGY